MRTGDAPTPAVTAHTIPPDAALARWPVGLHVALEQLPRSAYTWDDATTGTWDDAAAAFVWDAPFTATTYRDVACDFQALDIDAGAPDELNLYPPVSATLTLANQAGEYTPWTADGRLVYWAPGRRLAVWTERRAVDEAAWQVWFPGTPNAYLVTVAPITTEANDMTVTVRVQADWTTPVPTNIFPGIVFVGTGVAPVLGFRRVTGQLQFYWYVQSSGTAASMIPLLPGGWPTDRPIWLRAVLSGGLPGANRLEYHLSPDAAEPVTGWTTFATNTSESRHRAGTNVTIGADGEFGTSRNWAGRVARVIIRQGGITALDVGDADLSGDLGHAGKFTAATGQAVTVNQPAGTDVIRPAPAAVTAPTWQLWFPGTPTNVLTVADAPDLNIAGDFSIMARIAPDDWTPGAIMTIAGKDIGPGFATRSWLFRLPQSGRLQLLVSTTGIGAQILGQAVNAVPGVNGAPLWVRADRVAATGAFTFYWAPDAAEPPVGAGWTSLTGITGTAGNQTNGAQPVMIGGRLDGATEPFAGRIMRVIIRPGPSTAAVSVLDVREADVPGDLGDGGTFTPAIGPGPVTVRQAPGADVVRLGPAAVATGGTQDWLFHGRVAEWVNTSDGAVSITAYDGLAELAQPMADDWTPGVAGDTPRARLAYVAQVAGYRDPIGGDTGHVSLAAPLSDRSPLEEIQMAALSDGGLFYADPDGELIYRDRYWRQGRTDQARVWQVSDNVCDAGVIVWDAEAAADDDGLATYVDLVNVGGLRAIAQADSYWTDARYRLTHPDPDLWQTQAQGDALARYLIAWQSSPAMSVRSFTLYLADPNQPDLWEFATTVRRGDVVNVLHAFLDAEGAPARLDLFAIVTAVDHNVTPEGWTTTVRLSRSTDAMPLERWDVTGYVWDQADKRNVWRF